MAQSYQLISAQTLTSGAQSITFTNIPQNYTDLRILFSARVNTSGGYSNVKIGFNGSTSNITWRAMYAYSGSSVGANTGSTERVAGNANATSSTSSTFSNVDVYITNYTSTSVAKTISGESVVESNDNTNPILSFETNYWNPATQAAITSIELTNSASPAADFVSGSTFYLYGIGGARASGGTITADANYTYHTFTSTGTFTTAEKIRDAEALVIAGGGGGGANGGGGGGGGGLRFLPGILFPAGNTYTITVGAGGAGGVATVSKGSVGADSTFLTITSTGGGGGGSMNIATGVDGGSGGGGATNSTGGTNTQAGGASSPVTSPVQGFAGGSGTTDNVSYRNGGGGGGAGEAGGNAHSSFCGSGGNGSSAFSSWGLATSTGQNSNNIYYYAGGAGGGGNGSGTTGLGGAGVGGVLNNDGQTAGTANTGGGGGGGSGGAVKTGGAGGSGLVIIRYPNS